MANVIRLQRQPGGATALAPLARVKPELAALPRSKVVQLNVQVQRAVSTVMGALPAVQALRTQIARVLPTFDLATIDKLPDFAEALNQTDLLIKAALPMADERRALLPEAKRQRTLLDAVATALTCQGLLRPAALKRLKGGNGYTNLAHDLQLLASTLRAAWSKVDKSCPMPLKELDRATQLADALRGSSPTDTAAAALADAKDLRCRAFTRLDSAYAEVRRAVAYLRAHQGDADSIAPSLYPGRPGRRTPRRKSATPKVTP